jgi:Dolichyl-phosphate-mannose-protein mannosyltransferase
MRPLATAISFPCLAVAAIGWPLGYHAPAAFLELWALSLFVGLSAARIERHVCPAGDGVEAALLTSTIAFAVIVAGGMILGGLGWLAPAPFLLFYAVIFGAAWFLTRSAAAESAAAEPAAAVVRFPLPAIAAIVAMIVLVAAVGLTHPPQAYDSLNYHLYFPARWIQDGRLAVIPTPFGDEAPAYAPVNGELFFLWLMIPFHGDLAARIGQVPFYLLAGVALYALARRLGARPEHAIYPPAFFLLAKPIVDQAAGANVDLVSAAMFLVSLALVIRATDSREIRDWLMVGVALGLYGGTKFVSLVFAPAFLLVLLWKRVQDGRWPGWRVLWSLPGLLAFALPWYVRNWIVAGSPLYPASLTLEGIAIARGAFTRQVMLHSPFHVSTRPGWPLVISVIHAFDLALLLVALPFLVVGTVALARRWRTWPVAVLLAVPVLLVPLYWFGVPENVEPRFLTPVVGLALLPMAFVFGRRSGWNAVVHALYAAGLVGVALGWRATVPAPGSTPWLMKDWLTLEGPLNPDFAWLALVLAILGAAWYFLSGTRRTGLRLLAYIAVAVAVVGIGFERRCEPAGCAVLETSPNFVRPTTQDGWAWMAAHTTDATVAYAGTNVPYPLFGDRLSNRVYYVNIDYHADWRFDDYDRAQRRRPDYRMPDFTRPRFERQHGSAAAWMQNLRNRGVTYLFVGALSTFEDALWQDAEGFPVEDTWAASAPAVFELVFANRDVRIYAVHVR